MMWVSCYFVILSLLWTPFGVAPIVAPPASATPTTPIRDVTSRIKAALASQSDWYNEGKPEFVVSSSGKQVVLIIHSGNISFPNSSGTDLYLLTPDDHLTPLTHDLGGYESVTFSPDEKQIAYVSMQGAYVSFDGTAQRPDVSWTVYMQDIATRKRRVLFREKPSPYDDSQSGLFDWLPNKHQLLYSSTLPQRSVSP